MSGRLNLGVRARQCQVLELAHANVWFGFVADNEQSLSERLTSDASM